LNFDDFFLDTVGSRVLDHIKNNYYYVVIGYNKHRIIHSVYSESEKHGEIWGIEEMYAARELPLPMMAI
jgi:hypothetical protein